MSRCNQGTVAPLSHFRATVTTIVATVILGMYLVACGGSAPEDQILERYDERYAEMALEFPDSQECEWYTRSFATMDSDLEAASNEMVRMQQQAAWMWQQGYISERERNRQQQEYASMYTQYSDARIEKLRSEIGWSQEEFYYCYARVNMANDPGYCSSLSAALYNVFNAGLDLGDYHVIGIEFCLEQSPNFLQATGKR